MSPNIAPYIPPIDPSNASDTQNFDETFLDMEPVIQDEQELAEESDRSGDRTDTDKTDGEDSVQTPAQSRSPSVQPVVENDVDLFDGYSFKGRHSVLIDEEDEEAEIEEEEEEEEGDEGGEVDHLVEEAQGSGDISSAPSIAADEAEEAVPKTPEARKPSLPELSQTPDVVIEPIGPSASVEVPLDVVPPVVPSKSTDGTSPSVEVTPTVDKGLPHPKSLENLTKEMPPLPPLPPSPLEEATKAPSAIPLKANGTTRQRGRREKSGIAALDKYLSDGADEDVEQDDDDDWDLVEAPGGEDRNGAKGTSLFARGVVDRYRLAVFRKASTPGKNNTQRNFSGMSQRSDISGVTEISPSPSPSEKHQRRGRNPALTFRRNPKQFLRNRSPVPPPSSFSNASGRTLVHSGTMSPSVSSSGLITPSPSTHTSVAGPSLKSKESTISMGSPSSDDQSLNEENLGSSRSAGDLRTAVNRFESPTQAEGGTAKRKVKKLKKYKENAEKMLSLFASPRP